MKKGIDYTGITVVFFCHDGDGEYLLAKRSNSCRDEHGRWDPGGGALEVGHSVEETLSKEILEEYGTNVIDFEFLGYRDVHREHNGEKTHWIALDFKVQVDRSKVKNNEPHKFDEIGWFKINELPQPLHSQMGRYLEKYRLLLNNFMSTE